VAGDDRDGYEEGKGVTIGDHIFAGNNRGAYIYLNKSK